MQVVSTQGFGKDNQYVVETIVYPNGLVRMRYFKLFEITADGCIAHTFLTSPRIDVRVAEGRLRGEFLVAADGVIFSLRSRKRIRTGLNANGYPIFTTRFDGRKGESVCMRVHRVVAEAFIPNPIALPEVNHKDGNKLNACIANLEWCTREENINHAFDNGLMNHVKGVLKENAAVVDESIIRDIRCLRGKLSERKIARRFNISKSVVHRIHCGDRYASVI